MTANHEVLSTHELTIGYAPPNQPRVVVATDVDTALRTGEFVCLIGPNGAGKSTLMRTIAGMQPSLGGQIRLMGEDSQHISARALAQRLSIVLTDRTHPGLLTGYGLVALGRHPHTGWLGKLSKYDEEMVRWAVDAVGATHLAPRMISELSDGERQKIMIARALAQDPALMILDEPTAFLDLPRRVEIMGLLKHLTRTTGRAILLSTHDLDLALRTADRIWLMSPGQPLQVGAPEDLVLSGAFEAAFHSEGVQFDPWTGSFKTQPHACGAISLAGSGLPLVWTRRALEREGFAVVSNGGPRLARVEIENIDGPRWRLESDQGQQVHTSLHELIGALMALRQRVLPPVESVEAEAV